MRTNLTHFVATIVCGKLRIFAAAIALLFPAIGWSLSASQQPSTIRDG